MCCKVRKRKGKCVFHCCLWGMIRDVIILLDRCCLYWVDHLQSIARWEEESKKERTEQKRTDKQTVIPLVKVQCTNLRLSNEHPRQTETETTPYLSLLSWELQCWERGIAKSYIKHTANRATLFGPHITNRPLKGVWKTSKGKNWQGINQRESRDWKKKSENVLYAGSMILFSI